ncbi:MAG: hypothetical protein AB7R67_21770 [Vicinamibacterales bacterium]
MAKKPRAKRQRQGTGTAGPPPVLSDATVIGVMVGGRWHSVEPGTWRVDLRPPFVHAAWRDTKGRLSAFLSHVQMVRHRDETKVVPRRR